MARFDLNETTENEILSFWRTSTRLDRAVDLVRYGFVEEQAPDIFSVQSQTKTDKRYLCDLRAPSCECPDWVFRGSVNSILCKHIQAAILVSRLKPVPQ
jgi:hypothetical protein